MGKEGQKENPFQFIDDAFNRQPLLKYALEIDKALSGIVNKGRNGSQPNSFFFDSPREFYINGVLDQIQAPLMYLLKDCVSGLDIRATQKPNEFIEFYENANEIHLSLWRRKFIELLTDVKLFAGVSNQKVYLHYGLLHEYIKVFNINSDLETFYKSNSLLWKHSLELIESKILEVEDSLNIQDCWYLKTAKKWNDRKDGEKLANRIMKSFRQRYLLAHKQFDPNELVLTELTYAGYSKYSQDIHATFSPFSDEGSKPMNFDASINIISIFALTIYRNIAIALHIEESAWWVKRIGERLDNKQNEDSSIISQITYKPEIEVGDFVLVNGHLAEVKDVILSDYNFRSFVVHFLSGLFVPNIAEDSIPAYHVKLFQKKQGMKESVLAEMEKNGLVFHIAYDEAKWDEILRRSITQMYNDLLVSISNRLTPT